jgi:hypothetical protein
MRLNLSKFLAAGIIVLSGTVPPKPKKTVYVDPKTNITYIVYKAL